MSESAVVRTLGHGRKAGDKRESAAARPAAARALVLFLLVLCMAIPVSAARPPQTAGEAGSRPEGLGEQVRILPEAVVTEMLQEGIPPGDEALPSPPAWQGRVVFVVESPLPAWGVAVELGPVTGPEGMLPNERIWLRCPPEQSERIPAASGAIVAVGHTPVPASEMGFVVEIQPTWFDAPGVYRGTLKLIPFAGEPGAKSGDLLETAPFVGQPRDVEIEFNLREITMVASLDGDFTLQAGTGFGRFEVKPDMDVFVASNASAWEIRLEGTGFTDGEHEIPLSRVVWSKVDARGCTGRWTPLGEGNVLLAGRERRGVFEEKFRLALDVTMADPAGQYGANLQLVGSSGQ